MPQKTNCSGPGILIEELTGHFLDSDIQQIDHRVEERKLLIRTYVLLVALKIQEDPQRRYVFKTKPTVKGKVCEVIIDSGSSENFFLKQLFKLLNSKLTPTLTLQDHLG
ncbi:hypothetical protein Dimus_005258 [Dionaea muscipula]